MMLMKWQKSFIDSYQYDKYNWSKNAFLTYKIQHLGKAREHNERK